MRVLFLACLIACGSAPVPAPATAPLPPVEPQGSDIIGHAPASVVHGTDGQAFDLASLWTDKRVLLVFYMGHWCPHCQKQLGDLNARKAEFAAAGATIVAVSTDTPEDVRALTDKLGLGFAIYSDPQMETIAKWGVADYDTNVAKPSSFVIQPGGAITFRKIGQGDLSPSVDELLVAAGSAQ